ncbi:hypothetical protein Desor_2156 [Desulfosporosinus orientis DSM 765]|uniref:Uncharacterized protein n=1 Tax=Desulfosporosinus orientis (strain ATCC 19365 / DSM 765 / NCIMB 8382 / VKM B-1628 / Singapore I) TaxID=768706 RepID=G7W8Q0_DESOD|nr:hypothetical protein [Desulfosporosinus orientis]AET67760.1 hypothetical protein Desor_2156 [Desulfosporosinus orientis DSM 765]
MGKLLLSLLIGLVAGVIDIIPMLIQKLDKYSIISALIQWIVVGVVVSHIQIELESWLKGLVIAVLMGLPIIVLVMKNDAKSALPILMMCVILGSFVGFISDKYVR